jgi:membrane associated rhomboid family serine protease
MMQYYQRRQFRFGFGGGYTTQAVKYLLFANGIAFLLQNIFGHALINWFGLVPANIFKYFCIWQFITYMFLHGDFLHILLNMFILWMFGCEVERNWGSREFLKYYFICGVGAGLFHLVFNLSSPTPVVGASGAIYGILIAFAMLFPDRPIIIFPFFIPLKAKYWVIIFGLLALLPIILDRADGIAHFAHLGGMVIGFLYLKFGWKLTLFQRDFIGRKKKEWELQRTLKFRQQKSQYRKEVDELLDKINEVGYENLTEKEKRALKKASEFLSNENEV